MPIMLRRRAAIFLLLALSLPAMAQEDAPDTAGNRPLNLSLPRDAIWSPAAQPNSAPAPSGALPELGSANGQRGRMPYGAGYEARQRGSAQANGGRAPGMRGSQGGQGMGRRR